MPALKLQEEHYGPKECPQPDDDEPNGTQAGGKLRKARIRPLFASHVHAPSHEACPNHHDRGRSAYDPALLKEPNEGHHNGQQYQDNEGISGIHSIEHVRWGEGRLSVRLESCVYIHCAPRPPPSYTAPFVQCRSLPLLYRHALDHIALLNIVNYVLSLDNVAKHGVLAIKVRLRGASDKELTAIRVGAGVGH